MGLTGIGDPTKCTQRRHGELLVISPQEYCASGLAFILGCLHYSRSQHCRCAD